MSALSSDARSKIDRYHRALAIGLTLGEINRTDHRFRLAHRIDAGSPLAAALDAVLEEHRRRVNGQGCPDDCDKAAKEAAA